jgi:hypothetical protein
MCDCSTAARRFARLALGVTQLRVRHACTCSTQGYTQHISGEDISMCVRVMQQLAALLLDLMGHTAHHTRRACTCAFGNE